MVIAFGGRVARVTRSERVACHVHDACVVHLASPTHSGIHCCTVLSRVGRQSYLYQSETRAQRHTPPSRRVRCSGRSALHARGRPHGTGHQTATPHGSRRATARHGRQPTHNTPRTDPINKETQHATSCVFVWFGVLRLGLRSRKSQISRAWRVCSRKTRAEQSVRGQRRVSACGADE
jgi:hypothetical protein